jgi:hypothetical protein
VSTVLFTLMLLFALLFRVTSQSMKLPQVQGHG